MIRVVNTCIFLCPELTASGHKTCLKGVWRNITERKCTEIKVWSWQGSQITRNFRFTNLWKKWNSAFQVLPHNTRKLSSNECMRSNIVWVLKRFKRKRKRRQKCRCNKFTCRISVGHCFLYCFIDTFFWYLLPWLFSKNVGKRWILN